MAFYLRTIATMQRDTGLPEDKVNNVFHARSTNVVSAVSQAAEWHARLHTLYQVLDASLGSVLTTDLKLSSYDMTEVEPRVPILESVYTDLAPGATSLPEEVAYCLSMEGFPVSGADQAHRRGRIYMGPLISTVTTIASGRVRVQAASALVWITAMADAVFGAAAENYRMSVYSPTVFAATGELNASFTDVYKIWGDDAFDTQRRRGPAPTARQTVVAP